MKGISLEGRLWLLSRGVAFCSGRIGLAWKDGEGLAQTFMGAYQIVRNGYEN